MTKRNPVLAKYIFPVILLLLPLWNVWSGIDVVDTGYSLAYYRFFPQLDGMWFFSTFLANLAGWLLNLLPGGQTLLGMNIYTSLLIGVTAAAVYFVLAKRIPPLIAFAGEALTIFLCWCPTVILYHYLTYIFFTAGALLLYYGLANGKERCLPAAGILLGINAFVRVPSNFLEVALIAVVWYAGRLNRERFGEVLRKTCLCAAGYLFTVLAVLGVIGLVYGFDNYLGAVLEMAGATESASDYTLTSMLVTVFRNLTEGFVWLLKLGLFFAAGILVQLAGKKKWIQGKLAVCFLLGLGGLFLLMRQGFFDRNYQYHLAVYRPFLVFVWITVLCAFWQVLSGKTEKWEKIWAAAVLAVTVIMPFGTNNHLYANMNNLFFVAPFTLYAVWKLCRQALEKKSAVLLSAGSVLAAYFLVFFIQSAGYGMNFVLLDGYGQEKRDTKTEGIAALEGMYTSRENAGELTALYAYLREAGLADSELITMGSLPGLHYFFDMPCAVSVLWPDLNTSSLEVFGTDLQEVSREILQGGRAPVIVASAEAGGRLTEGAPKGDKEAVLYAFLLENGYENGYADSRFMVFKKQM